MDGWFVAIALAALVFAALLFFARQRKQVWTVLAAVLVLALAGYAFQGRPSLPNAPAPIQKKGNKAFEDLITLRADMDRRFSSSKQWLMLSDSYARDGNFKMSAAFLQSALLKKPNDGDLWAALGLVLMLAGDGTISPPSEYAFQKARALSPRHPAPDYFRGLNALFNGDAAKAVTLWEALIKDAPKTAKWRPKLESQLLGLKSMLETRAEDGSATK